MTSNSAKFPKFLKLRTSDNQVMEVSGQILNESLVIRELFKENNDNPTEVEIPVDYSQLKKVVKTLEVCDLNKPFVMFTDSPAKLIKFAAENMQVLKFMTSLPGTDAAEIFTTSTTLFIPRLIMVFTAFMMELEDGIGLKGMRERFGLNP
uniref:Skp1_POZ domain-containing protein n=1 Tax=Panagrellus redivivus TaxID=6233 RepID=A0A7E4VF36_PANRE